MLSVLTEIAEKARWQLDAFQGKLKLSGRVLSPIEAQAAGIASKTLISRMMQTMKDEKESEMTLEQQIEKITPEDILTFGAMQDRVLCQVVDKASQDGGETWEKLTLVQFEKQQNPKKNVLWVGMITQEDKNSIFEEAMMSVKEAADQADNFRE
tara:strand:- start:458 stop:919 length:462 start_codon:yes stop_codon:yes gene_type:complete